MCVEDCITETPLRALTVNKTVDAEEAIAGQVLTYTVDLTNAGAAAYTAAVPAVITDDLTEVLSAGTLLEASALSSTGADRSGDLTRIGDTLQWSGALEVGEVITISYRVEIPSPAPESTVLVNTVSGPPETLCDPECTTSTPVRALAMQKEASPAEASPGDTVTYTLALTNVGAVDYDAVTPAFFDDDLTDVLAHAENFSVTSALIDGVTDVSGDVVLSGDVLSWSGALAQGATLVVTYTVDVLADPEPGATLVNTVTGPESSPCVDGTEPGCTTSTPVRSLGLSKTVSVTSAAPGEDITYVVRVENTGGADYAGPDNLATVTDDLSDVLADATLASATAVDSDGVSRTAQVSVSGTDLTWTGPLSAGTWVDITYVVTIADELSVDSDGVLANSVSGPPETVCEGECTTQTPIRALHIDKSASQTELIAGEEITYTVAIENTGAAPYDDVNGLARVEDDMSDALLDASGPANFTISAGHDLSEITTISTGFIWEGPLAVDETVEITYTLTVEDPLDTEDGLLANTVTGPPESNCSVDDGGCTVTVPARQLAIDKQVNATAASLGDMLTYSVTVTNTGLAPYTDAFPASIVDDLADVLIDAEWGGFVTDVGAVFDADAGEIVWEGPLAPDESVTIEYTVTVNDTLAVVSDGVLSNSVSGPPEAVCADDCTTETPVRALAAVKTASADVVAPGDLLTYSVVVTNVGGVDYPRGDGAAEMRDDLGDVLGDAAFVSLDRADDSDGADRTAEVTVPSATGVDLVWTGPLDAGDSVTLVYTVRVADNPREGESLVNAVLVTDGVPCEGVEGGCATETLIKRLSVTKEALVDQTLLGGTVDYAVTIANTGSADYTVPEMPASFTDGLSDVLADASFVEVISAEAVLVDPDTGEETPSGSRTFEVTAPSAGDDTLTWSGPLAVSESLTVVYRVQVADTLPPASDAVLSNSVTSLPESSCPAVGDPGCTTDTPIAAIELGKSTSTTVTQPGGEVTYTVTIANIGAVDYSETTVTDDLSAVLPYASEIVLDSITSTARAAAADEVTLPEGEATTMSWSGPLGIDEVVTLTYTVTVADPVPDGALLTNTVDGPDGTVCAPEGCDTSTPMRKVTIDKQASVDSVIGGDTLTYTVTVTNTGTYDYTDGDPVSIADDLTGVLTHADWADFVGEAPDGASFEPATSALTWSGSLAAGDSVDIAYAVTVHEDIDPQARLVNAVTGPPETECVEGCGTDTPVRALALAKSAAETDALGPYQIQRYTIAVTNTGGADYTAEVPAVVTDDLADVLDDATMGVNPVASTGDVSLDGSLATWRGALSVGDTATITYTVRVLDPPPVGAELVNIVTGPPESTCEGDDATDGCGTTTPVRALAISKSSDAGDTVDPGATVEYTVVVTNTGTHPYSADEPAQVTDDLSGVLDDADLNDGYGATAGALTFDEAGAALDWSGALDPGDSVTITYSVTVHDPVTGNRVLANTVTGPPESVCAIDPSMSAPRISAGRLVPTLLAGDNPACSTNTPITGPRLSITKTVEAPEVVGVGDTITWTVTVVNVGEADYTQANAARIIDDLSEVLDDATLGDVSVTGGDSAGLTIAGATLTWEGTLAAGATVTVTYSAKVRAGGDGVMGNIAFDATQLVCEDVTDCVPQPPPAVCVDGTFADGTPCDVTVTVVTPPSPTATPTPGPSTSPGGDLPRTGGAPGAAVWIAIALVGAGAVVLVVEFLRRRRSRGD